MIGYLRGKVLECSPERLLLDVGGVGYQLAIPLSTFSEIDRTDSSGPLGLYVHTHVRDGAIELFGFWTTRERRLFELLIGVSGIGPKLARVALSGMSPEDIVAAIASSSAARLSTIPGIGKKTAERMVVELKDRVGELAVELPERATSTEDDLLPALVTLGYKRSEAEQALMAAREDHPDADFQELLRMSLKRLSRSLQ
jgi:Holliday junction DNA helicase RuvA